MIRQRKSNRLYVGRAPGAILKALALAGGSVLKTKHRQLLAEHCASPRSARDCHKQLLADGLIEVCVKLTPRGRSLLASAENQGKPCIKSARTVAKKDTLPTVAPVDRSPLAMAWMWGRP